MQAKEILSAEATFHEFVRVFRERDANGIVALVADDCVMESMQPAPNGTRVEGREANIAFWQAMIRDAPGEFEVEDLTILGDRAIEKWRYRFGEGEENSVRGVTLLRAKNGKIVEALAYAKTAPQTDLGQGASASP